MLRGFGFYAGTKFPGTPKEILNALPAGMWPRKRNGAQRVLTWGQFMAELRNRRNQDWLRGWFIGQQKANQMIPDRTVVAFFWR